MRRGSTRVRGAACVLGGRVLIRGHRQAEGLERQLAASKELLSTQLVLADRWEAEARFYRSLTGTNPELSIEVGDA